MSKRINIILPDQTVATLDRVATVADGKATFRWKDYAHGNKFAAAASSIPT